MSGLLDQIRQLLPAVVAQTSWDLALTKIALKGIFLRWL